MTDLFALMQDGGGSGDLGVTSVIILVVGNIATLLAIVLKNANDNRRERDRIQAEVERETRLRQWAREDRELLARQVTTASTTLASEVAATSTALASEVKTASTALAHTAAASHTVLADKIDENTKISVAAFEVGNHVNEKLMAADAKIAQLTELFHASLQARVAAVDSPDDATLKRVDETTRATLDEVKKL